MTRPAPNQAFFDWTDASRALAATLVVISHARDVLMIDYPRQPLWLPFYAITGFGHSAVIVFFVLSGFWISRSVLARIDDASFWLPYLIDRLSRLEIVLIPALALGGALDVLGAGWLHLAIYQGRSGAHALDQNIAANLTLPVLLGNLAFLQTIIVNPFGSNGSLWSVAYEFWYYLWFPALAVLVRHRRPSPVLLALLIGVIDPALYGGFVCWLVGLVLLIRVDRPAGGPAVARRWAWLAAALFAATLIATGVIHGGWTDIPLAVSFGLLLLAAARSAVPFPRRLALLARYGRSASFSLYAIHFPILALAGGAIIGRARLVPGAMAVGLVLALTMACLAAGWLFAQASEAHTPQLRQWLRQRLLLPPRREGA